MAGRGRGRGKSLSFNVEALGFGRGESLPGPIQQPPPLYPPVDFKPVPLLEDDAHTYLLALKQEFRSTVKELPYYLQHQEKKKDIERYSDKYQSNQQDGNTDWQPDWRRLPAELRIKPKKVKRLRAGIKPNVSSARKGGTNVDVSKTLEELEKKEQTDDVKGEGEEEEEDKEGEGQEEEEYYEEEDMEEETDYNMTYFDNGENYGNDDEDDALDDGPVY